MSGAAPPRAAAGAPAAAQGPAQTPAQIAKGALRRLALAKLEPTPENYARAWAEESGQPEPPPPPDAKTLGPQWAQLVERIARGLERAGRQWTAARKRDSLQRVLDGSRGDLFRLQQRLGALASAWEGDRALVEEDEVADAATAGDGGALAAADPADTPALAATPSAAVPGGAPDDAHWAVLEAGWRDTVRAALPPDEARAQALADRLARLADALAADGPRADHRAEAEAICSAARRLLGQRHRLVEDLAALTRELGQGLVELAEDDSWARGQCEALTARLGDDGAPSARGVRAAAALLAETRERQGRVRQERDAAREALKSLIRSMLADLGTLGEETGRFGESVGRHAEAIERADSLESLAGVVREMVQDSRAVQQLVGQTQARLAAEHAKAGELESRVRALEGELRRLSEEVSTDALTQVANRRGLAQAFEAESARAQRAAAEDAAAPGLALGLIDIDNFKRLNDTLGHAAGDEALRSLAAAVRERLRPVDHLARFGGEEFVVLLPATAVDEAQQALTRLQRSLTEALFLHEGREVFVTFSAGVTAWRPGEALETALERADEALYEAKRSGKNRTCIA